MPRPPLSEHFRTRQPSPIRLAGMRFASRPDPVQAINVAIGNVSLPMHPAMIERMKNLGSAPSPFCNGVVGYTSTVGDEEPRRAFLQIIASSGGHTEGLHCQITDGGSQAMELVILGTCGPAGTAERPLMLIDAAYTNYQAFAARLGRKTVHISRSLSEDGHFSLATPEAIRQVIQVHRPGALVVIPYDNPTGQFYDHASMVMLARLCVEFDMWLVSDEAYRELHYRNQSTTSVWNLTEAEVPAITGRRISIETASKLWNACGLRIGALVTDNQEFHVQCVAENTAALCSSAIGQYIFGALAHETPDALRAWYDQQRDYYRAMLTDFAEGMKEHLPGAIVSSPDASLYSVVDVRNLVGPDFQAQNFVLYCAAEGAVDTPEGRWTVLVAPMAGFYSPASGEPNPGRTQMRVAYVEPPEQMRRLPALFAALFHQYLEASRRQQSPALAADCG